MLSLPAKGFGEKEMPRFLLQICLLLSLLLLPQAAFSRRHPSPEPASSTAAFSGKASWYGKELHGRRTASGKVFNMHELTAAHRTLPFGTKLLVKNRRTGRSCIVTITDRGPHRASRCIDVSQAAARQLGIYPNGEGHISAHLLDKHHRIIQAPPVCVVKKFTSVTITKIAERPKRLPKPSMAVPAEVASAWQSL
jgi:rare lipoprotein A